MNTLEYIKNAVRTEVRVQGEKDDTDRRLDHAALGLCTECGELLDAVKKSRFYNRELDATNVLEELGDVMWYVAIACDVFGGEEMAEQIDKVKYTIEDVPEDVLDTLRNAAYVMLGSSLYFGAEVERRPKNPMYAVPTLKGQLLEIVAIVKFLCDYFGGQFETPVNGVTLFGRVMQANIDKLRKRYPEKFDDQAAAERDISGEREVLEEALTA